MKARLKKKQIFTENFSKSKPTEFYSRGIEELQVLANNGENLIVLYLFAEQNIIKQEWNYLWLGQIDITEMIKQKNIDLVEEEKITNGVKDCEIGC